MAGMYGQTVYPGTRFKFSCLACKKAHRTCSRVFPCTRCRRRGQGCVFPLTRKRKKSQAEKTQALWEEREAALMGIQGVEMKQGILYYCGTNQGDAKRPRHAVSLGGTPGTAGLGAIGQNVHLRGATRPTELMEKQTEAVDIGGRKGMVPVGFSNIQAAPVLNLPEVQSNSASHYTNGNRTDAYGAITTQGLPGQPHPSGEDLPAHVDIECTSLQGEDTIPSEQKALSSASVYVHDLLMMLAKDKSIDQLHSSLQGALDQIYAQGPITQYTGSHRTIGNSRQLGETSTYESAPALQLVFPDTANGSRRCILRFNTALRRLVHTPFRKLTVLFYEPEDIWRRRTSRTATHQRVDNQSGLKTTRHVMLKNKTTRSLLAIIRIATHYQKTHGTIWGFVGVMKCAEQYMADREAALETPE